MVLLKNFGTFSSHRNQYIDHRLRKLVKQLDREDHDIVDHNRLRKSIITGWAQSSIWGRIS